MKRQPSDDNAGSDTVNENFRLGGLISAVLAVIAYGCSASAAQRTLAWDANPGTVSGYTLYRNGTALPLVTGTTATIEAEPGDLIAIAAVSTTGISSDQSPPIIMPPPSLDRTGWVIAGCSSEETRREATAAVNAIDGKPTTFWHSVWEQLPPHYIAVKLPRNAMVSGLSYLPRQDGIPNGSIQSWEVQSSMDGIAWEAWGKGIWPYDATMKRADLPLREVRYFRLWGNDGYCNAAELWLSGSYVPETRIQRVTTQWSDDLVQWHDTPPFELLDAPRRMFRQKIERLNQTITTP